ncbi:MAG: PAS domain-containing protein [bacterium]|nr:PAS domain-containing protein [bacterium]
MVKKDEARDVILDSVADGVFTVDRKWRITSFNRAAEKITGVPREQAVGQQCCDVFRASICESHCALKQALETGQPVVNKAVFIVDPSGRRIPISVSAAQLKDKNNRVIGGVETFRDLSVVEELRRAVEKRHTYQDIVSKNKAMQEIFDIMPSIAESDATVLIQGKSGTGKELVARALHDLSPRRKAPMVTVNCGAVPDTLLESELFGYKTGAFTDARREKPGRFALAEAGTLFLDEIADVSPAMQVRLLRVLQDGVYEPLGATESVTANLRIIAASNRRLDALVKKGSFREDLFYRLNVVQIALPPLKDRREDIPLLVDHFIRRFNFRKNKSIEGYSPDVLAVLMHYDYPGNVRELENIVEHAFVLCRGVIIELPCLPPDFLAGAGRAPRKPLTTVDDFERKLIEETLINHQWNRTRAAAELGMHATTLWRKLKKLGISPPS